MSQPQSEALGDADIKRLRDTLYVLGDVIADVFADLHNIDQRAFEPPNDLDDWLGEIGGNSDGQ